MAAIVSDGRDSCRPSGPRQRGGRSRPMAVIAWGESRRTPWQEHRRDPCPAAVPSLPPCGSRGQGVMIGVRWRRSSQARPGTRTGDTASLSPAHPGPGGTIVPGVGVASVVTSFVLARGGGDCRCVIGVRLCCPPYGGVSDRGALSPIPDHKPRGVVVQGARLGDPEGGMDRRDCETIRETGWRLRRTAAWGAMRFWQITCYQGLADLRVRHMGITPAHVQSEFRPIVLSPSPNKTGHARGKERSYEHCSLPQRSPEYR